MASKNTGTFPMSTTTRKILAGLTEEHLTGLLREAIAVARHSKRARHNGTTRLHASDINQALALMGNETLYGTAVMDATALLNPQKKIKLSEILSQELPPAPTEVSLVQTWLAVDGQATESSDAQHAANVAIDDDYNALIESSSSSTRPSIPVVVQQLQSGLLSEELKLYLGRVTTVLGRGGKTAEARRQQDAILSSLAQDEGLQELVPFLVQYIQQQLYQLHATSSSPSSYNKYNSTSHGTTTAAEMGHVLVRLVRSLLRNKHLHLELHLHSLLPALMTCVVAQKPMGYHSTSATSTTTTTAYAEDWTVRREAATALAECSALFSHEYTTLAARILKTYCQAVLESPSLWSQFGGITGLTLFGPRAIQSFVLPVIASRWTAWDEALRASTITTTTKTTTTEEATVMAVHMCQQAVLLAVGRWMCRASVADNPTAASDGDAPVVAAAAAWSDVLGDRCTILCAEATDYNTCFV